MDRKYSHVIVVGIDGAGSFIKDAETPVFDRIFANGALTYDAIASNPSISAECWGSMLIGVGPEIHKLTNGVVGSQEYPKDSPFPSLFKRIAAVYPDAELGSYCDWNPITAGIIERDVKISTATARDDQLTPMICDYIREKKPDFLFVQMDSVDGAGHRNGYGTEAHLKRISEVDILVGDIYNAAKDAEILDDTLFIVIADHGGTNPGDGTGTHGGWTDGEKYVTLALSGKTVKKEAIPNANVRDLSAIVLYALGIEAPQFDESGWTSQIPDGIFNDETIPPYRDISHLTGASPRISKVPHTSELI
ncbi:MAG: alkaline phosphatase family protein [Clostridia bacterium]|nr:alkaline phosphatase family protein [Clostridia bacterium]